MGQITFSVKKVSISFLTKLSFQILSAEAAMFPPSYTLIFTLINNTKSIQYTLKNSIQEVTDHSLDLYHLT
jgi:hypothetical protein